MIREEGLFGGLSDEQLAAMPKVLSEDDGPEREGMSLGDLTWPIPRRLGSRPETVVPAAENENLPGG